MEVDPSLTRVPPMFTETIGKPNSAAVSSAASCASQWRYALALGVPAP